jgi:RNA polymerase sigma-70 factor (ECF subfamily)
MFATTRWSLIVAARGGDSPPARQALAELCRVYWYPLYAYIRRRGHGHDAAQDLTQDFFARLLEKNDLAAVDPARGRFRSFLLAACQHFLANRHDHDHALKRGGGRVILPIDFGDAERRYGNEPAHEQTPERLFERRWALALLDQVLNRLRGEYEAGGKGEVFARLKGHLTGGATASHAEAASALGISEGAFKVAVHRLRKRYRDLLREEIAQTLDDPAQTGDEIRALFVALGP